MAKNLPEAFKDAQMHVEAPEEFNGEGLNKGGVVKMSGGGEVPGDAGVTPQLPAKYTRVLQVAQQRGPEALAAAHFVLQQNDPEYNALVNAKHKE